MPTLDPWAAIEWPETHSDPWGAIEWPQRWSSMAVVPPPVLKEHTSPTAHLSATNPWTPILQSSLDSASAWPVSTCAVGAWAKVGRKHIRKNRLPTHRDPWTDGKENVWDDNIHALEGDGAASVPAASSAWADHKEFLWAAESGSCWHFPGQRSRVSSEEFGRPCVCMHAPACTSSTWRPSSLGGKRNKARKIQKRISWGSTEVREYEIPEGAKLHPVWQ